MKKLSHAKALERINTLTEMVRHERELKNLYKKKLEACKLRLKVLNSLATTVYKKTK